MNHELRPSQRRVLPILLLATGIAAAFAGALLAGRWLADSERVSQKDDVYLKPQPILSGRMIPHRPEGELLYATYCAKCHGPEGQGDPDAVERLTPPPRDFSRDAWRFSKTAESIEKVIRDGIPGTAMAATGKLFTPQQRSELAQYVLELAQQPTRHTDAGTAMNAPITDMGFHPLAAPRPAPEFRLQAADGREMTNESVRGDLVLVNFWGTTCEHCLREMPHLTALTSQLEALGFTVLSVCADEDDLDTARRIAAAVAPELPVFVDATGLMTQQFNVQALPTFWLIDRQGRVIARRSGALDWSAPKILQALRQQLTAP